MKRGFTVPKAPHVWPIVGGSRGQHRDLALRCGPARPVDELDDDSVSGLAATGGEGDTLDDRAQDPALLGDRKLLELASYAHWRQNVLESERGVHL